MLASDNAYVLDATFKRASDLHGVSGPLTNAVRLISSSNICLSLPGRAEGQYAGDREERGFLKLLRIPPSCNSSMRCNFGPRTNQTNKIEIPLE